MKERPILMSAPMVRAILAGTKTQTRRAVKLPVKDKDFGCALTGGNLAASQRDTHRHCPYGQPGDRLRVKEHAWMFCERRPNGVTKTGRQKWHYVPLREAPVHYCEARQEKPTIGVVHPETGNEWGWRKKLGRFLPAWASRITLEIVSVRVERLNDITEADARDEGGPRILGYKDEAGTQHGFATYRKWYRWLWESINGAGSWAANPWVWVVEFRRIAQ